MENILERENASHYLYDWKENKVFDEAMKRLSENKEEHQLLQC